MIPPDTYYGFDTPLGNSVKVQSVFRENLIPQPPHWGWVAFWAVVFFPAAFLVQYTRRGRQTLIERERMYARRTIANHRP
jgi:hypothetical protein